MAGAVRDGDVTTGHSSCSPVTPTSYSSNVMINGRGAVRQGDTWVYHCTHTPVQLGCSTTVMINGRGAARIGDSLSCGDVNATGSSNVIIG